MITDCAIDTSTVTISLRCANSCCSPARIQLIALHILLHLHSLARSVFLLQSLRLIRSSLILHSTMSKSDTHCQHTITRIRRSATSLTLLLSLSLSLALLYPLSTHPHTSAQTVDEETFECLTDGDSPCELTTTGNPGDIAGEGTIVAESEGAFACLEAKAPPPPPKFSRNIMIIPGIVEYIHHDLFIPGIVV